MKENEEEKKGREKEKVKKKRETEKTTKVMTFSVRVKERYSQRPAAHFLFNMSAMLEVPKDL